MLTAAQGRARRPGAAHAIAQVDVELLDIITDLAGVGHGIHARRHRIQHADPCHAKTALLNRDEAGFMMQRQQVAFAHDGLIDIAQHGQRAVEPPDAFLRLLALGDLSL